MRYLLLFVPFSLFGQINHDNTLRFISLDTTSGSMIYYLDTSGISSGSVYFRLDPEPSYPKDAFHPNLENYKKGQCTWMNQDSIHICRTCHY